MQSGSLRALCYGYANLLPCSRSGSKGFGVPREEDALHFLEIFGGQSNNTPMQAVSLNTCVQGAVGLPGFVSILAEISFPGRCWYARRWLQIFPATFRGSGCPLSQHIF